MTFSRAISTLVVPDYMLMRTVNRWQPPRWIRLWMIVATRGGDGWLWAICGLTLLASSSDVKYAALSAGALAAAMAIVLFRIVKKVVGRKRPCSIETNCWASLLPPDQFSFPSGHSMTAFAVALSLGLFYPAWLSELLFIAASVAASRILLGMHFLSDVLAGSAAGVAIGYLAFCIAS